jgi:hypothetical protein
MGLLQRNASLESRTLSLSTAAPGFLKSNLHWNFRGLSSAEAGSEGCN